MPSSHGRAGERILRDVDDVARDAGRRRTGTSPEAGEEARPDHLTLNRDGVERAVDVSQRVALGHQCRMDSQIQSTALEPLRHGQGPNHVAEVARVLNVAWIDLLDALGQEVARQDASPERKAGNERQLVTRIAAGDVERRVRLGETCLLRGFERIGERSSFIGHAGQDVVAGPVDDAPDGTDVIGSERLSNHADHGDGASHGGLEIQIAAIGRGEVEQSRAALGEQRLVRGDDVLLRLQRRPHQALSNVDAADELDDDIDVVPLGELKRVVEQSDTRIQRANDVEPGRVLVRDCGKPDGRARSRADDVRMLEQDLHQAFADHAASANSNPNFAFQSSTSEKRAR